MVRNEITPFGILLESLLEKQNISARELARRTDCTSGFVSHVKQGKSGITTELLAKWIDVFCLNEEDNEGFIDLAYLASAPVETQERYQKFRSMALAKKSDHDN